MAEESVKSESEVEVDLRDVESRHSDEKLERIFRLVTEFQKPQQDWNPLATATQRTVSIPKLGLYRLSPDAILPTRGSKYSACWDVYSIEDVQLCNIGARNFYPVKTGWRLVIPQGFRIDVRARSGLAAKQGVTVLNAPGTIDHDYEDELMIILGSVNGNNVQIYKGERIAQIVLERVQEFTVAEIDEEDLPVIDSDRVGGLGSTGA